jgi:hypothetical protein
LFAQWELIVLHPLLLLLFIPLGSPFHVNVRDRLDANRVNVKMNPNMRANVLQEILIDGQAAGPGSPSVDITDAHGEFSFYFFTFFGVKKNYNLPCSITIINVCVYLFKMYLFTENRAIHK